MLSLFARKKFIVATGLVSALLLGSTPYSAMAATGGAGAENVLTRENSDQPGASPAEWIGNYYGEANQAEGSTRAWVQIRAGDNGALKVEARYANAIGGPYSVSPDHEVSLSWDNPVGRWATSWTSGNAPIFANEGYLGALDFDSNGNVAHLRFKGATFPADGFMLDVARKS